MSKTAHVQQNNRNGSQDGFMFAMKELTSFAGVPAMLATFGLTLNRAHIKPSTETKDAQLMLIFERGKSPLTQAQQDAVLGIFLTDPADNYSFLGSVRRNPAVAATSEVHKGTPEHILISLNGATPPTGREENFRLNEKQREAFERIPQVRMPLHLPEDMVGLIPVWVETRPR